jgi:rubredoxin
MDINAKEKIAQETEPGGDSPNHKPKTTHKEVLAELISALTAQFKALKEQVTCPECNTKGRVTNHGKGGGALQHKTSSIQLECKACNKRFRPDKAYEKSGLKDEKEKYEQTLKQYQARAEKALKDEDKAKINAGPTQTGIQNFFQTPRPKADVSETKGDTQETIEIDLSDDDSDNDSNYEQEEQKITPKSTSDKKTLEAQVKELKQENKELCKKLDTLMAMMTEFMKKGTPVTENQKNQQNAKKKPTTNNQQPNKSKVHTQQQQDD